MNTMDKVILNTFRNNEITFPEDYILKTLELYMSKGLTDNELHYFCSTLKKDNLISEDEWLKIKNYLSEK